MTIARKVSGRPTLQVRRSKASTATALAGLLIFLGEPGALAQDALPRLEATGTNPVTADPGWPKPPTAPTGAPNVLLILTDDVGFGSSSTFGGPVPTPTLDALAKHGLRYNQFNTAALCAPTRAALLTGRNPHSVGMGAIAPKPYEGYNTVIPKSAGMISEVLRENGFNTAAFGKWHLTPDWEQSQAGPFDRWPTGEGFEYFYGFHESDTSQWNPTLIENTKPIDPAAGHPSYNLDVDLADHAITWLRQQHALAPSKPFFLYYATGTAHAPHHAPKEWLQRFRGKFDQGWDVMREETFARQKAEGVIPRDAKLTLRPDVLPAWSSLDADHKRLYARQMEAYAAALAHADHEIGRIIDALRKSGELDNTLVIFMQGDNGSSAEGGPDGAMFQQSRMNGYSEDFGYMLSRIDDIGGPKLYNHYPAAWAWAMNTPFQYYKQIASYFGGTRNGLVVSWPEGIKARGLRQQFHFVTDIAPTIYGAVGVPLPMALDGVPQKPLDGVSMKYSFESAKAVSERHVQYFEFGGNVAIYRDGWLAAIKPVKNPWDYMKNVPTDPKKQQWQLFNIFKDYSEADDLAAKEPQKLREMQELFWAEAARNKVLALQPAMAFEKPSLTAGRTLFRLPVGLHGVPLNAAPPIVNRSFSILAELEVPDGRAQGVIITQGGRFGGWALYLKDGKPTFHYNALDPRHYTVQGQTALAPGVRRLVADFKYDGGANGSGGELTLSVDGQRVAQGHIDHTLGNWISHTEGLDVGFDTGTPVNGDYTIETSKFSGGLDEVTIALK